LTTYELLPSAEEHRTHKSSSKTTREKPEKRESEMVGIKKWEQVTLVPLLKEQLKNCCLQSLSGLCVRCDPFTKRDAASCKPSVLPNKFRLTLKVAVTSIQKCLKEKEIRSFIQSTFIDIKV